MTTSGNDGAVPEQDEAVAFAAALARQDVPEAARLAGRIRYGIEVVDGAPGAGVIDGSRVLPVFVTFESWQRFGSDHEIRLVAPELFATVVANSQVDAVLFEPSLDTATQVPVADVLALLRGEAADDDGSRLMGDVRVLPFPALHAQVSQALGADGSGSAGAVWALCRVSPGGSVPLIAVSPETDDDQVTALVERLRRHELPADLEVIRLDEADAGFVDATWSAVRL